MTLLDKCPWCSSEATSQGRIGNVVVMGYKCGATGNETTRDEKIYITYTRRGKCNG